MKLYIFKVETQIKDGSITPRIITLIGRASIEDQILLSSKQSLEKLLNASSKKNSTTEILGKSHEEKNSYIIGCVVANSRKDAWQILENNYSYSKDYMKIISKDLEDASCISPYAKVPFKKLRNILHWIYIYGGYNLMESVTVGDNKVSVRGKEVLKVNFDEQLKMPIFEPLTMFAEEFAKKQRLYLAYKRKEAYVRYIKKESINFILNEDNSFCEITSSLSEELFEHAKYIKERTTNPTNFSPKELEKEFRLKGCNVELEKCEGIYKLHFYTEII
jgi:hypothetical protein